MRSHGTPMPSHKGLTNVEPFSLRTAVGKGGVATRCSIPGRLRGATATRTDVIVMLVGKKTTSVWVTAQVVGSQHLTREGAHAREATRAREATLSSRSSTGGWVTA